ncbi:MAG TPA: serine protease, partial [Planctomycetota bacterium]|nr:serine protease [Planctomycetota bacterium]
LALMELKTSNTIKPLPLQGTVSGLKCPQEVTVIGHPKGLEFTVITARLSNLNRIVDKNRMLQFDGDADHGMSGGPIIDTDGNVIGVVQGGYDEIKGQCLGVISEHVRDLCKKCNIEVTLR